MKKRKDKITEKDSCLALQKKQAIEGGKKSKIHGDEKKMRYEEEGQRNLV